MRGESFEPGGCSAWPTSPDAAATMREPEPPPAIGATGLAAPTEPVPAALWSIPAKEFALPGLAAVWAGAGGAGGANAVSRAEMRARTASMLTCRESASQRRSLSAPERKGAGHLAAAGPHCVALRAQTD